MCVREGIIMQNDTYMPVCTCTIMGWLIPQNILSYHWFRVVWECWICFVHQVTTESVTASSVVTTTLGWGSRRVAATHVTTQTTVIAAKHWPLPPLTPVTPRDYIGLVFAFTEGLFIIILLAIIRLQLYSLPLIYSFYHHLLSCIIFYPDMKDLLLPCAIYLWCKSWVLQPI